LTFLGQNWRIFTFSKGKCKIPWNFDFSLRILTFSSKIPPKYRGKSEKPEAILHFPLKKGKNLHFYLRKVKILRKK